MSGQVKRSIARLEGGWGDTACMHASTSRPLRFYLATGRSLKGAAGQISAGLAALLKCPDHPMSLLEDWYQKEDNSGDFGFSRREVGFCSGWCLDNLCK